MSNFNELDFSNFGIISNTIGPTPEAFLIKEVVEQNTMYDSINNKNNNNLFCNSCYTPNDLLWNEEDNYDECYNDYDNDDDDDDYY